jgi:hypothetical protein
MISSRGIASTAQALLFAACATFAQTASAESNGLTTIDNPGGGQIVYGPLTGQANMSDAMVLMLRKVHNNFGDRPQVGKFFESKDRDSVAVFFTVTARNQGNKQLAGLVIVHMPSGSPASAAVLYDEANRFGRTEPAMMQKLNEAWSTGAASRSGSGGGSNAAPAAPATPMVAQKGHQNLTMSTAGDRSASMGLAPGWQLKQVAAGSITAEGPNGEFIGLGLMIQGIQDPRHLSRVFPGQPRPIVCPYGGNLFDAYVCVVNQNRQRNNKPAGTFKLSGSQPAPDDAHAIIATYEFDRNDGTGPRKGSARIGEFFTPGANTWVMMISASDAPVAVADAENATIVAMCRSFTQDQAVINRETAAIIDNIHAQARASKAQADAINARSDAQAAAFNSHMKDLDHQSAARSQHMDDLDRSSKAFQNYTLDQSVVRDNDYAERGTISNGYADALVRANPDRFQVVQNQDMIKGKDY